MGNLKYRLNFKCIFQLEDEISKTNGYTYVFEIQLTNESCENTAKSQLKVRRWWPSKPEIHISQFVGKTYPTDRQTILLHDCFMIKCHAPCRMPTFILLKLLNANSRWRPLSVVFNATPLHKNIRTSQRSWYDNVAYHPKRKYKVKNGDHQTGNTRNSVRTQKQDDSNDPPWKHGHSRCYFVATVYMRYDISTSGQ